MYLLDSKIRNEPKGYKETYVTAGQQERYHYLPHEVIAQHLGMESLKW